MLSLAEMLKCMRLVLFLKPEYDASSGDLSGLVKLYSKVKIDDGLT